MEKYFGPKFVFLATFTVSDSNTINQLCDYNQTFLIKLYNPAAKAKTQRIKNKKRGGILKRRSKSAERIEEMDGQRHSDDFEEKLREWSVKQGHHPSYYSEIRDRVE